MPNLFDRADLDHDSPMHLMHADAAIGRDEAALRLRANPEVEQIEMLRAIYHASMATYFLLTELAGMVERIATPVHEVTVEYRSEDRP